MIKEAITHNGQIVIQQTKEPEEIESIDLDEYDYYLYGPQRW